MKTGNQSKHCNRKRNVKVSSNNSNNSVITCTSAIALNLRQGMQLVIRVSFATSNNSTSNSAARLSVLKNRLHKSILLFGRDNKADTVLATECSRKSSSDSELTKTKGERTRAKFKLYEYVNKAFELSRVGIISLTRSATLATANQVRQGVI